MHRSDVGRPLVALTVVLLVAMASGCASAPRPIHPARGDYEAVKGYLRRHIAYQLDRHDVPGLGIALVDGDEIVWAEGFGYADKARKLKATPETLYRVGSLSKPITATAVMRLVERDQLDLDKPIGDYIPEFAVRSRFPSARPITTRSLLAHHSGLPSDRLNGMWTRSPASLAEVVTMLQDTDLAAPPGSLYRYSNLGYALVGRALENVTGEAFVAAMQDVLLTPLGMTSSSFAWPGDDPPPQYAKPYRGGREAYLPDLRDSPAGSMCSSVLDLGRYLQFVLSGGMAVGGRVLSPDSLDRMLAPQYPNLPFDFGHQVSLAWMMTGLTVNGGERVAWHNGAYPGFKAHLSFLPDRKLGVVVLTNSDDSDVATEVGIMALRLALEAKLGSPLDQKAAPEPRRRKASDAELQQAAGSYVMMSQVGSVTNQGRSLVAEIFGRKLDLIPVEDHRFMLRYPMLWGLFGVTVPYFVEFKTVDGVELAQLTGLPGPYAFEKIHATELPAAWRDALGEYECVNPQEDFTFRSVRLESEAGLLVARLVVASRIWGTAETKSAMAVRPISESEAVVVGVGNGEGDVLRLSRDGNATVLTYSGFKLVKKS